MLIRERSSNCKRIVFLSNIHLVPPLTGLLLHAWQRDNSGASTHLEEPVGFRQHCRLILWKYDCWTRRNTHNHQRVSEQKIQIIILILKRGPCLEIARESQSELGWARVTVTEWARDRARVSQWEQEWASESLAHKHLAQSWSCTTMRGRLAHKAQNWGGDWLTKHKIEREIGWQNRLKQICSLTQSYYCWLA